MEIETKKSRLILLCALFLVLMALGALYFFVRPAWRAAKPLNESGIVKLSFERKYASGETLKLSMKQQGEQALVMTYDSTLGGRRERLASASRLLELQRVVADSGVYHWDGYYERAPAISGESSFSLTIAYTDGRDVSASGVTMLPRDIDEGTKALKTFFYAVLADEKEGASQ